MGIGSKIKIVVVAFALALAGVGAMTLYTYAEPAEEAGEPEEEAPATLTDGSWREGIDVAKGTDVPEDLNVEVTSIINGVLYIVGILAVVMVIIGGAKYTTSGGNQQAVTSAKNTILYGIVGLMIAILAYAIINFVVTKI